MATFSQSYLSCNQDYQDRRAYELFLTQSRELHEERHPGANIDENLFKEMAQSKWKQASTKQKAKFTEKVASGGGDVAITASQDANESPFVKFSRSKRSEILSKNPGISVIF